MRVVYKGPSEARLIAGVQITARRGEPVEVPAELALGLLARTWWMPAPELEPPAPEPEPRPRRGRSKSKTNPKE